MIFQDEPSVFLKMFYYVDLTRFNQTPVIKTLIHMLTKAMSQQESKNKWIGEFCEVIIRQMKALDEHGFLQYCTILVNLPSHPEATIEHQEIIFQILVLVLNSSTNKSIHLSENYLFGICGILKKNVSSFLDQNNNPVDSRTKNDRTSWIISLLVPMLDFTEETFLRVTVLDILATITT